MSLPWHFRIVSPGLAKATAGNCYSQLSLLYFEVLLLDLKCLFSGREEQWLFSTPLLLFLHSSSTFCSAWATPQGPSMRGLPVGRVAAPVIFFFFLGWGRERVCVEMASWITEEWIAASFYSSSSPHLWVDTLVFIFLLFPGNVSVG